MKKILIVIDMQNDFVTGALGSEAAQTATENIADHIKDYDMVVFTRDTHDDDYLNTLEGKYLPVQHCVKNTEGWDIVPELTDAASAIKNFYVIDKDTFGTFMWKNMPVKDTAQIEICGVCTDICVVSNALILRALYPNREIVCHKDWCAGTTKEAHEAALAVMKSCQIKIV